MRQLAFGRAEAREAGIGRQCGLAAEVLHASVAPYVALYTEDLGSAQESDADHRKLLAACRAGKVDAAHRLLVGHLERAEAALVDRLD